MGEKMNAYRILAGKPERKRPLRRPRRRWVDSIKMDLRDTVWGVTDWIDLALGSITFWEVPEKLHNWRLLKNGSAPRS
jgi:hypothetical protein